MHSLGSVTLFCPAVAGPPIPSNVGLQPGTDSLASYNMLLGLCISFHVDFPEQFTLQTFSSFVFS